MRRIVAIDVPMLTAVGCNSFQTAQILEEATMVLDDIQYGKACLLFADSLYDMLCQHDTLPNLFLKALASVNTENYVVDASVDQVTALPNVAATGIEGNVDTEIKAQLVELHRQTANTDTLYVIDQHRVFVNDKNLTTFMGQHSRSHDMVIVTNGNGVRNYFDLNSPKLVQHKHHQQNYMLGGNVVSPFTAYDVNDTTAAEELLMRAYDDYEGDYSNSNPPNILYTWDAVNKCYVCFHHSGRWEYHGHDLQTPYQDVPDYIKKKYHIWK